MATRFDAMGGRVPASSQLAANISGPPAIAADESAASVSSYQSIDPNQSDDILDAPVDEHDARARLSRFRQRDIDAYLSAAARYYRIGRADLGATPPNPMLIDQIGAGTCLQKKIVPLQRAGAITFVATSDAERAEELREELSERLGPVSMLLASEAEIESSLLRHRGDRLALMAENSVSDSESCRNWASQTRAIWALATVSMLLGLFALNIAAFTRGLLLLALLCMCVNTLLKIAVGAAALHRAQPRKAPVQVAHLPPVSIIVALYHESDIAARLVQRLSELDYPRDLLEICLAVEADDHLTHDALSRADLPQWIRIIRVPRGQIKTKPRALNHALTQCRGEIIGVYDAEDAPESDQIRRVVERFYSRGPKLACVQGMLDYYNPLTNWLSRCFTLEYATLFRFVLPGIERLGLIIPLGGTTLFFRRSVLEELGAWDAHNVTEDADLGVRLFRHGYRTEMLDTVTREEANCRPQAWVRQRSRWIKGYMMTWIVHMRHPVILWRQIGTGPFLGLQVQLLVSSIQWLLAPVLWLYWLLPGEISGLSPEMALMMKFACLTALVVEGCVAAIAFRRSGHRFSPFWIATLYGYFAFATLAAYKALWELATRPFYWDKTNHGLFDTGEKAPAGENPDPAIP